jgi:tetratricopeptide (TPR) repeat protein
MNKLTSSQPLIFSFGMILFILTAILGWIKLHYGFNFTDEGYYMTESWRLAAGDHFLKDKITGVLRLYTLVNSLIFKIYPDITLLGVRRVQFFLTIFSIIIFSCSLFKITNEYWYLPLIFSLYAFTGLNPIGSLPNLSYQTYPHLFITLHLSFFILGIIQENTLIRSVLLIISGIFLWAMSFTVPHLSFIISSPLFVYLFIRYNGSNLYKYTVKDFLFIAAPIVLGWLLFIGYYNTLYVQNLITSIKLLLSTPTHSASSLINLNWQKLATIGITLLYLIVVLALIKKARSNKIVVTGIFAASLIMCYIIKTSWWNQPDIFWPFSRPMWLAALLISFFILFILKIIFILFHKLKFNDIEVSEIIILIPVLLLIISSSIFSALGILSILQSSMPAMALFSLVFLTYTRSRAKSLAYNALVLVMIVAPFYSFIIFNNWMYNYADVLTEDINAEIDKGFGQGIKTNKIYKGLYDWIATTTETYTKPNDFIISYVNSSMVHMIAKRRPSLDDSFIQFIEVPYSYYENALMKMYEFKREPRLVFIFYSQPQIVPYNPKNVDDVNIIKPGSKYFWTRKQIVSLIPGQDPITDYVINHMYFLEKYNIGNGVYALCYIDNLESAITALNRQLHQQSNNPDIYYRIGLLWKQEKDVDRALRYFIKSNEIAPSNKAVYQIVSIYTSQGAYEDALFYLRTLYKLQPENPEISYNIACIRAKQNQVDDATSWLKEAVYKGFHNWDLIKKDPDLENIRNTSYLINLMKNH